MFSISMKFDSFQKFDFKRKNDVTGGGSRHVIHRDGELSFYLFQKI